MKPIITIKFLLVATFILLMSLPSMAAPVKKGEDNWQVSAHVKQAKLMVKVKALSGFHTNENYPWKLKILAEDGTVKQTLKLKDAASVTADIVTFAIPLNSKQKEKAVSFTLKFSLCNNIKCIMKSTTLTVPR